MNRDPASRKTADQRKTGQEIKDEKKGRRDGPKKRHYPAPANAGPARSACGDRNARMDGGPAKPPEGPEEILPGDCLRCVAVTTRRWAREREEEKIQENGAEPPR